MSSVMRRRSGVMAVSLVMMGRASSSSCRGVGPHGLSCGRATIHSPPKAAINLLKPDWVSKGLRPLAGPGQSPGLARSEEHTSELQSRRDLVCRLLLEKKKKKQKQQKNHSNND